MSSGTWDSRSGTVSDARYRNLRLLRRTVSLGDDVFMEARGRYNCIADQLCRIWLLYASERLDTRSLQRIPNEMDVLVPALVDFPSSTLVAQTFRL